MGREERRKNKRYNTEVKLYFDLAYNLKTKVKFQVVSPPDSTKSSKQYSAVSKNISIEGLGFVSHKQLKTGDFLHIEVYLPTSNDPIHMEGEVRWSKSDEQESDSSEFETGVQVMTVNGESVKETLHRDKTYNVDWSIVLESIFDNYKILMAGKFKS